MAVTRKTQLHSNDNAAYFRCATRIGDEPDKNLSATAEKNCERHNRNEPGPHDGNSRAIRHTNKACLVFEQPNRGF